MTTTSELDLGVLSHVLEADRALLELNLDQCPQTMNSVLGDNGCESLEEAHVLGRHLNHTVITSSCLLALLLDLSDGIDDAVRLDGVHHVEKVSFLGQASGGVGGKVLLHIGVILQLTPDLFRRQLMELRYF